MHDSEIKKITTFEAVEQTIHKDNKVLRWFLLLISHPPIRQHLCQLYDNQQAFSQLKKALWVQQLINIGILGLVIVIIVKPSTVWLGVAIAFIFLGAQSNRRKKHAIALISRRLLETDFSSQQLEHLSLYQIGEVYSERFHIPSLVDVLFHQDQWGRWTMLAAFGLICIINPFPLSTTGSILSIFVIYRTIQWILEIQHIYRRLT
jgi:hypothetical protein